MRKEREHYFMSAVNYFLNVKRDHFFLYERPGVPSVINGFKHGLWWRWKMLTFLGLFKAHVNPFLPQVPLTDVKIKVQVNG